MIRLQVIGNLGKDCVVNTVNGNSVINFNLAHSEKYKSGGVLKEKTIWVECAYWTENTGISNYLKKGTQVYVEGTPDVRSYTNKEGRHGASLSIKVQNVQLLGNKPSESESLGHSSSQEQSIEGNPTEHESNLNNEDSTNS
jgi:single-strand DNA-binding protein